MNVQPTNLQTANREVLESAKESNNLLHKIKEVMQKCVEVKLNSASIKREKTIVLAEINQEAEKIGAALQILLDES